MNTVEAKLDQIDRHDMILNGDGNGNVGLVRRVDGVQASLEHIARDIAAVKRIGLAILTAVLITMAIAALKVAFTEHPPQHPPSTSTSTSRRPRPWRRLADTRFINAPPYPARVAPCCAGFFF